MHGRKGSHNADDGQEQSGRTGTWWLERTVGQWPVHVASERGGTVEQPDRLEQPQVVEPVAQWQLEDGVSVPRAGPQLVAEPLGTLVVTAGSTG